MNKIKSWLLVILGKCSFFNLTHINTRLDCFNIWNTKTCRNRQNIRQVQFFFANWFVTGCIDFMFCVSCHNHVCVYIHSRLLKTQKNLAFEFGIYLKQSMMTYNALHTL